MDLLLKKINVVKTALPILNGSQLKILFYVLYFDDLSLFYPISISDFQTNTGLSRGVCIKAINDLIRRKLIIRIPHKNSFLYRINYEWDGNF